jgi:hypothetical protein
MSGQVTPEPYQSILLRPGFGAGTKISPEGHKKGHNREIILIISVIFS